MTGFKVRGSGREGSREGRSLKSRIDRRWQGRSIREKINVFVSFVFIIILMSVFLDAWTIKLSLWDFRFSLAANEKAGNVLHSLEMESAAFKNYTRGNISLSELQDFFTSSDKAVLLLPDDFNKIGEERLAWTQKITRTYAVYRDKVEQFLFLDKDSPDYISKEYEIYEVQDFLKSYSGTLLSITTDAVNDFYQQRFPVLFLFPAVILIIAIVMIVCVVKALSVMNTSLVEPIVKLGEASKKIAANDTCIDDVVVDNRDEIGDLVHAFNKMKFATREYITTLEANRVAMDKLHTEELQKKEIENRLERMKFEVLRHQINPHFLFNTLNVISGMACLEDAKKTDKMIKALSSLLRYNLRMEEKEITLEHELSVMNDYMYLQKMRFGERIKYEIEYSPDLQNASIPTFVLQPIVENSIVHGISPKEEGGYVRIKAEKTGDENPQLVITVADTGVGMAPDALEALRSRLSEVKEERKAIGVSNIYRRIKLMYPTGELEINSTEGEGMIVKIRIPFSRESEE